MICNFCKKEIVDDAIFCSYCGKRVVSGASNAIYKKYYSIISDYFNEIKPGGIDVGKYFNPKQKDSMNDIFYQFALNLQDYNMMPSVIGFLSKGREPVIREILFGFDCYKVVKKYTADSLFEKFCEAFPVNNKESKQNAWLKYSKGIIDSANLLSKFDSAEEFDRFIDNYHGDIAAIKWISKSVTGAGFALACNIIKDLGFTDYAKPDTHTIEVMVATGLTDEDDLNVINAIRAVANANNDSAFNLDRMIWLICSGYYFLDNEYRIEPHKKELIEKIKAC